MLQLFMLSMALLLAGHVHAEDTRSVNWHWEGTAELGSIKTTGNTDTSSVNAKLDLAGKTPRWEYALQLSALTSKEDDETSKERYKGTLGIDRKFNQHHYLATTLAYEFDRFGGYDYQTLLSLGYGYRLLNRSDRWLDVEAGPGYRYDRLKDDTDTEEEMLMRFLAKFFWQIQKGVELNQKLSINTDSQKTTWRSESGLKSQINGSLATKISYQWEFTDDVPPDTENTNSEFAVTLVYSF